MAKQQYRVASKKGAPSSGIADTPWPWILLALNPLFIVNGVHTIDFYIKAIWISAVLTATFWFTRRKAQERGPFSFNTMELMWLGYMLWGALSLLWVQSPVLTFERLVYLGYPMAAYMIGKQTHFWRSSRFWDVYAAVALLVGLIGACMWWFAGTPLGFDWIMSAGRPSSTLSYRAYAGTYMVTTLPFLLWYMFSRHIRSQGHFLFVATSFSMTFLFLVYTRARSGWVGLAVGFAVMAILAAIYLIRSQYNAENTARLEKNFRFSFLASFVVTPLIIICAAWWLNLPLSVMAFVTGGITIALLTLVYMLCSRLGGNIIQRVEKTLYGVLLAFVVLFGLSIALVLGVPDMAGPVIYLLGGTAFAAGIVSVGSVILTVALSLPRVQYKPILLVVAGFTLLLSIASSNDYLLQADTNPQTLKNTGKEDIGGAISTMLKILQSGSSDRVAFWDISRKMLFEKSVRGQFEGPGGMPHWVLGVGQNQWPIWVPLYSDILHSLGAEVHNDWIQAFVEGGPIGFFFWMGFTLALIYYTWRARDKGIMIAVMGCIFAWIFSTQSDFLTARIYGALWIGGIAAIIWGEGKVRPVFTLQSLQPMPAFRIAAGVFFLWLGVAYGITMWADRQIYVALVYRTIPVDQLVAKIFPMNEREPADKQILETIKRAGFSEPMVDYTWGVGKYLIFSPINDLSRAISLSMQKGDLKNQEQLIGSVQAKISKEVLKYHPYQYSALQMLADISFRQQRYPEAIEYNKRFLELRPRDSNMWLFLSQTQLTMGDSLEAAKSAYRAVEIAPDVLAVQQFWQMRISPEYREMVMKQQTAN